MFMSLNYKINPFSRMINAGEDIPSKDNPSSIPNRGPETVAPEEVDLDNHDGKGHTEEYPIMDENGNPIGTQMDEYGPDGKLKSETTNFYDGSSETVTYYDDEHVRTRREGNHEKNVGFDNNGNKIWSTNIEYQNGNSDNYKSQTGYDADDNMAYNTRYNEFGKKTSTTTYDNGKVTGYEQNLGEGEGES